MRVASTVSGEDQSDFFNRYVDGTEFLNVTSYFDAIGIQVTTFADEFYLAVRENATPEQRSMARGILGR